MSRLGLILAAFALGGAAVAAVVATVPAGHAASAAKEIPYFEDFKAKQDGYAVIEGKISEKGNATKDAGTSVFFKSVLRSKKGGPVIGSLVAHCQTTGFGIDLCRGQLLLNRRGSLTFDGFASSQTGAHVRRIAVVGGTREFAGARGHIESANQADTGPGLNWTIHLVD